MSDTTAQRYIQNSPKSVYSLIKLINQLRISENVAEQLISSLNILDQLSRNDKLTGTLRDYRVIEVLFKILANEKHPQSVHTMSLTVFIWKLGEHKENLFSIIQ